MNNKNADQPAHLGSLISTVVICYLENILSKLAACNISRFYLVNVTEQAGLSRSQASKAGFLETRPIWAGSSGVTINAAEQCCV